MFDRAYRGIFSKSNLKMNKLVTKYRRENKIYLITSRKIELTVLTAIQMIHQINFVSRLKLVIT